MHTLALDFGSEHHYTKAPLQKIMTQGPPCLFLLAVTGLCAFQVGSFHDGFKLDFLFCLCWTAHVSTAAPTQQQNRGHCACSSCGLSTVIISVSLRLITKWGKGEGCWRPLMDCTLRPGRCESRRCLFTLFFSPTQQMLLLVTHQKWQPPVCTQGSLS